MSTRLGRKGQRFFIIDYETTGIEMGDVAIEVGVVVTDERFRVLETFESLIRPLTAHVVIAGDPTWANRSLGAHAVHRINPKELEDAPSQVEVAEKVRDLARRHGHKPVLVSDNIQFEWHHTWALLGPKDRSEWPFHYCGWDTSLLLEAAGVGDPVPAHRALADAGLLHAAIVEALDRTRSLR